MCETSLRRIFIPPFQQLKEFRGHLAIWNCQMMTGRPVRQTGVCRTPRDLCFVIIIGRLRRNSLPTDQRDPGEFPYGTNKLGLTFCHIKRPKVRIVTYDLPKNLARFFVRTCGRFACFFGSHGHFYMAKRQGYVASRFFRRFFSAFSTTY